MGDINHQRPRQGKLPRYLILQNQSLYTIDIWRSSDRRSPTISEDPVVSLLAVAKASVGRPVFC